MKRRIVVELAAEEDLVETAMYILQAQPAAGTRFIPAARASFERPAEHPAIGRTYETTHPRLQCIRIWRVRGFEKYLIFSNPRTAFSISLSHSCPGNSFSSSNQGSRPSAFNRWYSWRTAVLSPDEWQRKTFIEQSCLPKCSLPPSGLCV